MSLATDIRAVSETAMEQIADRFDDLPRPLLAAIGAGDLAVEQLAALRAGLLEQFADTAKTQQVATEYVVKAQHAAASYFEKVQDSATNYVGKVQQAATAADLQLRAEQVAAGVAESIQNFATQIPEMAQGLVAELPDKMTEFTGDVSVDTVRDTFEAYTQLVGTIYGGLADRGDRRWSRVRSSSLKPGTVVDAVAEAPKGAAMDAVEAEVVTPRPAAAEPAAPQQAAKTPAGKTPAKTATEKAATEKAATEKAATEKAATEKAATPKTTRSKPTSTRTPRAPAESVSTDPR